MVQTCFSASKRDEPGVLCGVTGAKRRRGAAGESTRFVLRHLAVARNPGRAQLPHRGVGSSAFRATEPRSPKKPNHRHRPTAPPKVSLCWSENHPQTARNLRPATEANRSERVTAAPLKVGTGPTRKTEGRRERTRSGREAEAGTGPGPGPGRGRAGPFWRGRRLCSEASVNNLISTNDASRCHTSLIISIIDNQCPELSS